MHKKTLRIIQRFICEHLILTDFADSHRFCENQMLTDGTTWDGGNMVMFRNATKKNPSFWGKTHGTPAHRQLFWSDEAICGLSK